MFRPRAREHHSWSLARWDLPPLCVRAQVRRQKALQAEPAARRRSVKVSSTRLYGLYKGSPATFEETVREEHEMPEKCARKEVEESEEPAVARLGEIYLYATYATPSPQRSSRSSITWSRPLSRQQRERKEPVLRRFRANEAPRDQVRHANRLYQIFKPEPYVHFRLDY